MIRLDLGGAVQNNADDTRYLTVDMNPPADIILNLDNPNIQFPFGDNSVDEIRAFHIFEHIHNLIPLIDECHRILKGSGSMYVVVPKFPEGPATVDPTHIRFMVPENFHYFSRKFAYMGYTKRFWYMNLEEAINFNRTLKDVYFRIEMKPDKYEDTVLRNSIVNIYDAVTEDEFRGPNWDTPEQKQRFTDRLIKSMATIMLRESGMQIKRYRGDGEECGPLAGKKVNWEKLGFVSSEIERIKQDYDRPEEPVAHEAPPVVEEVVLEEVAALPEEVIETVEERCVACGSEQLLMKVDSMTDEAAKKMLLAVYPDAEDKFICPRCL